jgi:hypothetical protein
VPRGDATAENISRMGLRDGDIIYRCSKCDCIKPERAHHCRLDSCHYVNFIYAVYVQFCVTTVMP